MKWAVLGLALLLGACADDECAWYDADCQLAEGDDPPGAPSGDALRATEETIRRHAAGLPALLEALAAPGPAVLDWPGGYAIAIEVSPDGSFRNDPVRDGFSFAGQATRADDGSYPEGWLEVNAIGVRLRIHSWSLALPMTGRAEVLGKGLVGVLRWPGDGTGYFTGTYRETQSEGVPLDFALDG